MRIESYTLHRTKPAHPWLQSIHTAFVLGRTTPLLDDVLHRLKRRFEKLGHTVQENPDDRTRAIITTAPFGENLNWRDSLLFTYRGRYRICHSPAVISLMHIRPAEFQTLLERFKIALAKEPPAPADFVFPGLAPDAHRVLIEQGRRGGPVLSLERLLQAQAKCLRIILVVGDDHPLRAYHFDLVGAYPQSDASDLDAFYTDIVLRIVTAVSTGEVTDHEVLPDPLPRATWDSLTTPEAMRIAGQELGKRNFFTEMVSIPALVKVPQIAGAVASQYSEGCFATCDRELNALIATVTGSARPVDKGRITEDDLAVIIGMRPDRKGAIVRQVEGKRNDPPSSEAVEMIDMDNSLPRMKLSDQWPVPVEVPVVRSKLHGHRGISMYNPTLVEFVPLDEPYYHYPVSCATEAQARGIKRAFSRSVALRNQDDPRRVVFTILPGHGCVIVEKWNAGKAPFQTIWEYMDAGHLKVENRIPQGVLEFVPLPGGRLSIRSK
ncbi:MAG: hypothetical protein COS95_06540 [Ignavibacteriales bacterium CG07_land_8_20_14_0_80_59_12]|nr:MAG: hypothetical protein COS95_06540 [Ignavibacteriales bacterium CG07_land_8_20_14_0_80_59_12]